MAFVELQGPFRGDDVEHGVRRKQKLMLRAQVGFLYEAGVHAAVLGVRGAFAIQQNNPEGRRIVLHHTHCQKLHGNPLFERGREEAWNAIIFPHSEEVLEVIVEAAAAPAHAPVLLGGRERERESE